MNDDSNVSLKGLLFVLVLTVIFITLKITAVIAWPWLWVLSPAWISALLYFLKTLGIDVPAYFEILTTAILALFISS